MTLELQLKSAIDKEARRRLEAARTEWRMLQCWGGFVGGIGRACACGCGKYFIPIRSNHFTANEACSRELDNRRDRTGRPMGRPKKVSV